ncbi:MAG: hypothetical protein RLZZ262_2521 [Bacteroidota bacterium]
MILSDSDCSRNAVTKLRPCFLVITESYSSNGDLIRLWNYFCKYWDVVVPKVQIVSAFQSSVRIRLQNGIQIK